MNALFAYGTLQLPEVMFAVTGRKLPGQPATLEHYLRKKLRGECFPGIRPKAGETVDGLCFSGLDAQDLRRLDAFEGDYYRREKVSIVTKEGEEREACTYVLREEYYDLLLGEDWSLEEFKRRHLFDFISTRT